MSRRPSQRADLWRDARGVTTVETAIVALAFLLVIFGTLETGRMLWTWQALQSVAIDTARCVALGSSKCTNGATYAVTLAAGRGVGSVTSSEVNVNNSTTCAGQSNFTEVTITHSYRSVLPGFFLAPSGGLKATACYPNNA